MQHEHFHYKTLDDVQARAKSLNVSLPFAKDTHILSVPFTVRSLAFANRLGVAPMEGADADPDGSPSSLTQQRYVQNAIGGSAVLWFEAISIAAEGRSSATQLLLTEKNLDAFRRLTDTVREAGLKANWFAPILIMQANHSGRYSNPDGRPAPLIAYRHPGLEALRTVNDGCIVTDDYLRKLEDQFGKASLMARSAGFDAVDIKACHGYLLAELLSAFTRPGSYGGSYENRTRLLKNAVQAAQAWETPRFLVTARLGIYDGYPWPYGFGVPEDGSLHFRPDEPVHLVRELYEKGMRFISLTMGNPYATTHITRPFDTGKYIPEEHPLEGVSRMIQGIGQVKRAVPDMVVLASAPTYLRQFSDLYAAGAVEQQLCDGMLFGRMSFADPDFANEIIRNGRISPRRVCLTCGKCGDLIRAHKPTGCVVRNPETFLRFYREYQNENHI